MNPVRPYNRACGLGRKALSNLIPWTELADVDVKDEGSTTKGCGDIKGQPKVWMWPTYARDGLLSELRKACVNANAHLSADNFARHLRI